MLIIIIPDRVERHDTDIMLRALVCLCSVSLSVSASTMRILIFLTSLALVTAKLPSNNRYDFPGGDLPGMPVEARNPNDCAAQCHNSSSCYAFSYHSGECSDHGETCPFKTGCCTLKAPGFQTNAPNACTCAGQVKDLPHGAEAVSLHGYGNMSRCQLEANQIASKGVRTPKNAKNVLYIIVDDLRPELTAYGQKQVSTPNIDRLAETSMVFDRSYCQIAVCSPSRVSFLSGRRPDTTNTVNFVNHFRQVSLFHPILLICILSMLYYLMPLTLPGLLPLQQGPAFYFLQRRRIARTYCRQRWWWCRRVLLNVYCRQRLQVLDMGCRGQKLHPVWLCTWEELVCCALYLWHGG